jgi:xanthine dehydrogenase YagS FAD-binding subunit
MNQFEYIRASGKQSALSAINKDKGAAFLAGGTNLIDLMKSGVTTPSRLIDINNLPMAAIEQNGNMIQIGALVRNSDLADNALIIQHLPLLSMALKAGASPQLRNMATVGGNIMQRTRCSYFYDTSMPCNKRNPGTGCGAKGGYNRMHAIFGTSDQCIAVHPSDMCVAMTALNATVMVSGTAGARRIPFGDYHRLPGTTPNKDNNLLTGELITGVEIPFNNLAAHSHYLKVRDRASYAFALVSVGVALAMDGNTIKEARLAMGGVAHKPWRLFAAEKALAGKLASEETFKEVAALAMEGAKSFGENDFKLTLAPNTIVEALKTAAGI